LFIDNAIDADELKPYLPCGHMLAACKFSSWRIDSPFSIGMTVLSPKVSSPVVPSLQPQSTQLIALLFRLLGERGKLMAVLLISAAVIDSPCH
jgi:hypothetical protein